MSRPAGGGEELELKYDVDDVRALRAWLDDRYPSVPAGWQTSSVRDRYFDTADADLARAGYGARLRRRGGATTVTLKTLGRVAGARHGRLELEAPASASLDPRQWPASPARDLVEAVTGGRPLGEQLVVRQRRMERVIEANGSSLLASIDDAHVFAGGQELGRLRGLEIELVAGRRRGLASLERALGQGAPATVQPLSKLQLARAMVAAAGVLSADDLLAEAGRATLARHLARMREREAATRSGDPLALKQMRVATRRMRATWRIFDGAYRRGDQRRYVAELRRLARRLGAVRDLDVLLERLAHTNAGLSALSGAWREEREAAVARLMRHLDSPAYRAFVVDYRQFVGTPHAATAQRQAGTRVGSVAPALIRAAEERLLASGAALEPGDVEALHALRIAAKRLRYTLEVLRPLLAESPYARVHRRLVGVQDALGEINDGEVAATRARAWLAAAVGGADEPDRQAVARYELAERRLVARRAAAFASRWRRFAASAAHRRDMEGLLR